MGSPFVRRSSRLFVAVVLFSFGIATAGAQSLTVTTSLPTLTIHPGDAGVRIPIAVGAFAGYSGMVTVTLTGLPSGMTVSPANLLPGTTGAIQLSASVGADQEAFSPALLPGPQTATSTVEIVAIAGTTQATTPLQLTVSLGNPMFAPTSMNLPIVRINTADAPVTSTEIDVPGTITISSADGATSFLPNSNDQDTTATFHVHGHSTSLMPKLPYDVKLTTSLDLLNVMGLSCPNVTNGTGKPACDKSKSFLLLANYDDKTMLRDWAASALANAIPYNGAYLLPSTLPAGSTGIIPTPSGTKALLPWAPHSLFVELFLNGVYEGTYQLIEQVKVDSHRVNVTELAQTQTSGDLSGGYLLEIDHHADEEYVFTTPQGLPIGVVDPDYAPEVPEQTSYISQYVTTAENTLFSEGYEDPVKGWRSYFDEAAAINFYLVNEVMGNVDGGDFYSSNYLYKAIDNPYLYMGPVWDFDISSGNVNYEPVVDPTAPWAAVANPWYARLFTDPAFKAATQKQWNTLKSTGVLRTWINSIETEAATLQLTQQNNFGRWPMQGIEVWPNAQAAGSYAGELSYLLNWINLRMGFVDSFLNGTPATTTSLSLSGGAAAAGTPVTLTAEVKGTSPTGTVTFTYNSLVLAQVPLDGAGKATLTTSSIPSGTWQMSAVYGGDAQNALSAAPATKLTLAPVLLQTSTNLSGSPVNTVYGTPVALTAVVVGTSGSNVPSGTVTLMANGTPLGSAVLDGAGTATLTTSALPYGQTALRAQYSGDSRYAVSTSNEADFAISTDFLLITSPIVVQTLAQGGSVSYALSLAPIGGAYPGVVSMAVSGVPAGVSCAFNPSTIPASAGSQTVTLACGYTAEHAKFNPAGKLPRPFACIALLLILPLTSVRKTRRLGMLVVPILCASAMLIGMSGCGSSKSSAKLTSYTLTVTSSAGAVQHSVLLTLFA